MTFDTKTNLEIHNSIVVMFFGKFVPKNQTYQFKMKFDTQTNLEIQNSVVMFIWFVFGRRNSFWKILVLKFVIVYFKSNLVPTISFMMF